MRKPAFGICENKDADKLRGNREADQRLCFRYTDSTISLLPKYEISSLQPSSVAVQPGLCGTWSETPKTGFLTTMLKFSLVRRKARLDGFKPGRTQTCPTSYRGRIDISSIESKRIKLYCLIINKACELMTHTLICPFVVFIGIKLIFS